MNLLNGFTGLFSLGQAGFMLLGAYAYAVLCIPVAKRAGVYQQLKAAFIQFSLPETFANLFRRGRGHRRRILIALLIGAALLSSMDVDPLTFYQKMVTMGIPGNKFPWRIVENFVKLFCPPATSIDVHSYV